MGFWPLFALRSCFWAPALFECHAEACGAAHSCQRFHYSTNGHVTEGPAKVRSVQASRQKCKQSRIYYLIEKGPANVL